MKNLQDVCQTTCHNGQRSTQASFALRQFPGTVEDLKQIVQEAFTIDRDFNLQYMDQDFDSQFFSLLSTDEIKDKDTIKVVLINPMPAITLQFQNVDNATGIEESFDRSPAELSEDAHSLGSQDTVILSSPESISSLRSLSWPAQFEIPTFALDTELILEVANEAFRKDGTLFNNPSVKSNILDKLAESIFTYTTYPSRAQREQDAEALVRKHPCLKDPASFNGLYEWHNSIKYKIGNYRAKVRHLGLPELNVNSLKRKSCGERTPASNIKKAKRAEVNYLPPHPRGETDETLEKERVELLYESKKRNNNQVISKKMAMTFSLRRKEVIRQKAPVIDLKSRWPALFQLTQIEEEFHRISLKPLQSTFMGKLDHCMPKLLALYRKKGGAVGIKLNDTLEVLNESNTIEVRREAVIRGLITYMGENVEELIKDFQVVDDADAAAIQEDLRTWPIKIFVVSKATDTGIDKQTGIVIEGAEVLFDIPSVADACSYLMGLMYALELRYPKKLNYTFEVFQKIFLELEGGKMPAKVHRLKVSLLA